MSGKALFVVEGDDLEPRFFNRLKEVFGISMEIVPFRGNVAMLYNLMCQYSFSANIQDLLKQEETDPARLVVLNDRYTDFYLIFDCDPQHGLRRFPGETEEDAMRRNATKVLSKARMMAQHMQDSTSPWEGKLYINFPEMESFRDADGFSDKAYLRRFVDLLDLAKVFHRPGYKALSGRRSLARRNIGSFSKGEIGWLTYMNVRKLFSVSRQPLKARTYGDYQKLSEQALIVDWQMQFVQSRLRLWVLNTSLYFLVDYYGESFYHRLMGRVYGPMTISPLVQWVKGISRQTGFDKVRRLWFRMRYGGK